LARGLSKASRHPDRGRPQALAGSLDERTLLALGEESGKVVEVVSSVGETLVEGRVLLRVLGGRQLIEGKAWKKAFGTGGEHTFEQDPKYALRLL